MEQQYGDWMRLALREAQMAAQTGDVPVGAVLIRDDGVLLAKGHNHRETALDPTAHAELLALRQASKITGGWRLAGTTMVVTLEPCAMCAGALILARVARVVYAASDPKAGALTSLYQLGHDKRLNHQLEVVSGVLAEESQEILRTFFRARRKN